MKKYLKPLYNGIIKENPTFVLMLGMCPTLAVTTSAMNGMGMGLTTMAVLIMSNFVISALRNIIPLLQLYNYYYKDIFHLYMIHLVFIFL